MAYDKDVDYQAIIDSAVAGGETGVAAIYEQARNEKISGEGLDYAQTNNYQDALQSGAPAPAAAATSTPTAPPYTTPAYDDPYGGQIADIMDKIQNYGDYDPASDKVLQDMLAANTDYYTNLGGKAMDDTVAKVAGRTGGLASSYAGSAGQQAYNYYMDQANAKSKELEGEGYARNRNERTDLYNQYNMVSDAGDTDYGRFRDTVGDGRYEQETAAAMAQQGIENGRYDQQYADSRGDYADSQAQQGLENGWQEDDAAFNKAYSLIQMGFSTEEIASSLGIPAEQVASYVDRINNPRSSGGGGGGASPDADGEYGFNDTINMESVLSLGLGPLSYRQLDERVERGEIEMYHKNGQIYFMKAGAHRGFDPDAAASQFQPHTTF